MAETSTKPYMIRALHEWCTDNGYTPHIVVRVDQNTMVPPAHIREGQITLNIGVMATKGLVLGNDSIEFQARFNGVTENLYIPVGVVTALYARETGAGMEFEVEEPVADNTATTIASTASFAARAQVQTSEAVQPHAATNPEAADPKRPKLTIVK
jgi:stringent starvation protein B